MLALLILLSIWSLLAAEAEAVCMVVAEAQVGF
jgi:hypothetical protein